MLSVLRLCCPRCYLQTILADKDSQVVALHTETAKLKAQLLATNMDDDKRSLAALTKVSFVLYIVRCTQLIEYERPVYHPSCL